MSCFLTDYQKRTSKELGGTSSSTSKLLSVPSYEELWELYKAVFERGELDMIIVKNPDDETKLYWFLRKVMYCVHINRDHNSTQTYKDAVTESDEAFAFMVLALYGKKWKAGVTTRVSGDEKDGTIAFYAEKHRAISQIRENEKNKPFYIELSYRRIVQKLSLARAYMYACIVKRSNVVVPCLDRRTFLT